VKRSPSAAPARGRTSPAGAVSFSAWARDWRGWGPAPVSRLWFSGSTASRSTDPTISWPAFRASYSAASGALCASPRVERHSSRTARPARHVVRHPAACRSSRLPGVRAIYYCYIEILRTVECA
jgi:hypothetical protein